MSRRHPQYFKAFLFARAASASGFRLQCHFCPTLLDYTSATVDHEPALYDGGTPRGAVLACNACNQARSKIVTAKANARRAGPCHKRRKKRKRRK